MKAPSPPDPRETAAAQSQMNRDTAITQYQLNATNQVTPYGNLTYTQTGQNFQESPDGQTYYRSPDGTYSQTAPGGAPAGTGGSHPAQTGPRTGGESLVFGGGGATQQTGGGMMGGGSALPEGWSRVTGMMTPQFTATQTLSPDQQKLLDNSEQLGIQLSQLGITQAGQLEKLLGSEFKLPGGAMPTLNGPTGAMPTLNLPTGAMPTLELNNEATESRLMELGRKRLDPMLEQRRASREQDLFNRGVRPGSEAYREAMGGVSEGENDAYNQLMLTGRGQSAAEQQAMFNAAMQGRGMQTGEALAQFGAGMQGRDQQMEEALAQYQAAMQGRNQANQEYLTNRSTPINEILAMAGAGQVTNPNFINTPGSQISPPDYMGAVDRKYQADLANSQAGMSGLFGLGSALIGAMPWSDRRLKRDIKRVGTLDNGLGVYSYRLGSGPVQIGVMADEVEAMYPDAVIMQPSGFSKVDYARAVV